MTNHREPSEVELQMDWQGKVWAVKRFYCLGDDMGSSYKGQFVAMVSITFMKDKS